MLPGEQFVSLRPSLRYNGRIYTIHYFTTGSASRTGASLIGLASPSSFSDQQITGLLVTVDGAILEDEEMLREIYVLYRSAYYLNEIAASGPLGFTDFYPFDDFRRDLLWITRNPFFLKQFIKGLFESRQEKTEGALRAILTPQRTPPGDIEAFAQEARKGLEIGNDYLATVDGTLEAARFSNSRAVRNVASGVRDIFKSWRPITEQGQSFIEIDGSRLELFNALDLWSLGTKLIWIDDLQKDRAEWLEQYVSFATGNAALDDDQLGATAVVLAEVEDSWQQRGHIILEFAKERSVDLGIRIATEELSKKWVKWAWQKYGKRIKGHRAAGAASAALLGFTLANFLYGLDDLYSNFSIAESADELRSVFLDGRMQLQEKAKASRKDYYDGQLAAQFRIVYMLESLAAAQAFRAYGDGVEATVRKGLVSYLNPINWFKGREYREAAAGLRSIADELEAEAEDRVGHPDFVDVAVSLTINRLAVLSPPIGQCEINRSDGIDLHVERSDKGDSYVVCVNLDDPHIRFETVMANDVRSVNPFPDQREQVASMVDRKPYNLHHPVVAFNADYFGGGHGPEGLTVKNGFRVDGPNSDDYDGNETKRVSMSVSRIGSVDLRHKTGADVSDTLLHLSRLYNSVGGGPTLVRDGKLVPDPCPKEGFSEEDECRKTRQTAVGVSQDGRTIVVAVAESQTGEGMGRLLLQYGAFWGMKLDGGSSSQLWYRGDLKVSANGVANAVLIFREDIPRHDAFLLSQSQYPIVGPGESISLAFTLRNVGFLPWEPSLSYSLVHTGGERFSLPVSYPVPAHIPPNTDVQWMLQSTAPQTPGAYQTRWQLFYKDAQGNREPIGPEVGYVVTVVPTGTPPDVIGSLRQFVDELRQQLEGDLQSILDELQRRIEERIEEELRKRLPPELRCLLGIGLVVSQAAVVSQWRRKRRCFGRE
jgi:exopolysaccharide biosynthesis protein